MELYLRHRWGVCTRNSPLNYIFHFISSIVFPPGGLLFSSSFNSHLSHVRKSMTRKSCSMSHIMIESYIHKSSCACSPSARLKKCPWSYPTINIPNTRIQRSKPTAIFGNLVGCFVSWRLWIEDIFQSHPLLLYYLRSWMVYPTYFC